VVIRLEGWLREREVSRVFVWEWGNIFALQEWWGTSTHWNTLLHVLWPCFDDFTVNFVIQIQLKDYHFSHKFKQACQKNVVKYCSGSSQHDAKISKWVTPWHWLLITLHHLYTVSLSKWIYIAQFHAKHLNCARCTSISRTVSSSMCAEDTVVHSRVTQFDRQWIPDGRTTDREGPPTECAASIPRNDQAGSGWLIVDVDWRRRRLECSSWPDKYLGALFSRRSMTTSLHGHTF